MFRKNQIWINLGISMYAKLPKKLTFLTPWYAHVLMRIWGWDMLVFWKILCTCYINNLLCRGVFEVYLSQISPMELFCKIFDCFDCFCKRGPSKMFGRVLNMSLLRTLKNLSKSSSREMVLTLISIILGIDLFWECQNQLLINLFLLNIFLINVYNRGGSRTAATSKMERFMIIVKLLHLGCCCSTRSTSVRYALWYGPVHKKWRNHEKLHFLCSNLNKKNGSLMMIYMTMIY